MEKISRFRGGSLRNSLLQHAALLAITRYTPIPCVHLPVGVASPKGSAAAYIGVTVDCQLCACSRRLGWRSLARFRFLDFRFEDLGVAVVVTSLTALNLRTNSQVSVYENIRRK